MKHTLHLRVTLFVALSTIGCGKGAPVSPASGHSIAAHSAGDSTGRAIEVAGGSLLASLAGEVRELKPEAISVKLLSIRSSENVPGYFGIILLRGKGFGQNPTTASGEIYAVVYIDSTLTHVEGLVDTFPTGRGRDYDVWFQPETDIYPLVVCGQGQSYGDQRMRRSIFLGGTGSRADSVIVERKFAGLRWESERVCGIRGASSDESF